MADQYIGASGFVQQFGADKPAVTVADVSGQQVRRFTIKTTSGQKLVSITLFPEWSHVHVDENTFVECEGKLNVTTKGETTYIGVTPRKLSVKQGETRQEREVVNQQPQQQAAGSSDAAPF